MVMPRRHESSTVNTNASVRGLLPLGPLRRYYRRRRPRVPPVALRRFKVAAEDLLGQIMRAAGAVAVAQQVGRITVSHRHVRMGLKRFLDGH